MRFKGTTKSIIWLSLPILSLLAACAMGPKAKQLSLGMPQPQMIEIMGQPDGRMQDGNYEALKWANRLMSNWSSDRADYWVLLQNGAVVAYGPGEVRRSAPGVLILLPIEN